MSDDYPHVSAGERRGLYLMGWQELTETQRKTIYDLAVSANMSVSECFTFVRILSAAGWTQMPRGEEASDER